jgi:hypothetical protein
MSSIRKSIKESTKEITKEVRPIKRPAVVRQLSYPLLKTKLAPPSAVKAVPRTTQDVSFICNFLSSKKSDRISAEIDDDTYFSLYHVGEKFSKDSEFKYPVRKGQNDYEGRYFVDIFVDKDLLKTTDIQDYLREQVVVVGKAVPYTFKPQDKDHDISGWKIVMTSVTWAIPRTPTKDNETDE